MNENVCLKIFFAVCLLGGNLVNGFCVDSTCQLAGLRCCNGGGCCSQFEYDSQNIIRTIILVPPTTRLKLRCVDYSCQLFGKRCCSDGDCCSQFEYDTQNIVSTVTIGPPTTRLKLCCVDYTCQLFGKRCCSDGDCCSQFDYDSQNIVSTVTIGIGAIIGIVIGGIVFIVLCIIACVFCCCRPNRSNPGAVTPQRLLLLHNNTVCSNTHRGHTHRHQRTNHKRTLNQLPIIIRLLSNHILQRTRTNQIAVPNLHHIEDKYEEILCELCLI